MPKLTIDGQEIEVPAGTTILQAALGLGTEIPHYCYHPGLSIAGNCRMCLIEVEKAPKLMIGCQTQVADGMVVHTNNDRVKEAQQAVQEFLLINHPLDCPICDQAGECRLQEYAVEHGHGESRYSDPKQALHKAVDIGRHVMLDQERCIHCSRCIRFCDEVSKTHELAFYQRGGRTMIATYPGKRLDNAYSGNTVDICPVGALTLKEFRFATRVWYLKDTPSICAGCSRGCNVDVAVGRQRELMTTTGQGDDAIKRIVPRENPAVNGYWMCDEGRLSYQSIEQAERLRAAQAPAGSGADWDDAVQQAADRLAAAAKAGRLGAVVSPRWTCESMHAWRALFDALGGATTGVQRIVRGENDDLLIRADKGANSRGATWVLGDRGAEVVLDAAAAGKLDVLLVTGDALDPADTIKIAEAARSKVAHLIYVGPFNDDAARMADLLLPVAGWAEEDGTLVNFEGRIQGVRRCHLPRGEGRPAWRVALDLGIAAGVEMPAWTTAADVLASLASGTREFAGTTADEIGLQGITGAAAQSADGSEQRAT